MVKKTLMDSLHLHGSHLVTAAVKLDDILHLNFCLSTKTKYFYLQFNFLNCFASLFYIAFVLFDMKLLRQVSSKNILRMLMNLGK